MGTMRNSIDCFGHLTEDQRLVLKRVRQFVVSDLGVTDPRYDEEYLLKFCTAQKFEYEASCQMFSRFMDWRRENDVDNIASLDISPLKHIMGIFPHSYYAVDREGNCVYIEKYKKFELKEILKIVGKPWLINYFIYGYERLVNTILPHLTKLAGKPIRHSISIMDLDGVNFSSVLAKKDELNELTKITSEIANNYYPGITSKVIVVNTPMMFSIMWSIGKAFLSKETINKTMILGELRLTAGSSYKKDLVKLIAEDQLPICLGGTNDRPLEIPMFEPLLKKVAEFKTFFVDEHEAKLKELEFKRSYRSENGQNVSSDFLSFTVPQERIGPIRTPRGNKPVKLMAHYDEFMSNRTKLPDHDPSQGASIHDMSNYDIDAFNEFAIEDKPREVPNSARSLWT